MKTIKQMLIETEKEITERKEGCPEFDGADEFDLRCYPDNLCFDCENKLNICQAKKETLLECEKIFEEFTNRLKEEMCIYRFSGAKKFCNDCKNCNAIDKIAGDKELTNQNKDDAEHKQSVICKSCNDECDCHLFVGGSGKPCPDCSKQSVTEEK